jgi:D-Tyr-tRNAtyr deacylase
LQDVFKKAGITVTVENKREIDKAIHAMVGVKYKDCSATWREVKKRIAQDDEAFVSALRRAVVGNA